MNYYLNHLYSYYLYKEVSWYFYHYRYEFCNYLANRQIWVVIS
jgi:hypothetical protein